MSDPTGKLDPLKCEASAGRRGQPNDDDASRIYAVIIAGPTSSGKSALALRLACRLGGTIINADSMQVYRDLRILTAKPSPTRRRGRLTASSGR